ncbi:MAG: PRC-barrel domain-containing protein [Nanoarchaeota archaeon]
MNELQVIRKEESLEDTINISRVLGKHAVSKGGTIIGRVNQIRINKETSEIEGVVISRGLFKKPVYVGRSYFDTISHEAIILNVELSLLLRGKKVITLDGKVIGSVTKINRKGNTNDFDSIIVRSLWKKFLIPKGEIKEMSSSVILEYKYDESKKYLWKGD